MATVPGLFKIASCFREVTTNGGGEAGRDSAWHYERFEADARHPEGTIEMSPDRQVMKPVVFVRESPGLNTAKVAQVGA